MDLLLTIDALTMRKMFDEFNGDNEVFSTNVFPSNDRDKQITVVGVGERINYQPAGMTEKFADIEIRIFISDKDLSKFYVSDPEDRLSDDIDSPGEMDLLLTIDALTMRKMLGLVSDVLDVVEANAQSLVLKIPYSTFSTMDVVNPEEGYNTVTYWARRYTDSTKTIAKTDGLRVNEQEFSETTDLFCILRPDKIRILTDEQIARSKEVIEESLQEGRLTPKEKEEADKELDDAKTIAPRFLVLKYEENKEGLGKFVRYVPEDSMNRISWTQEEVDEFTDMGKGRNEIETFGVSAGVSIDRYPKGHDKQGELVREYRTCTTQDMIVRQVVTDEGLLSGEGFAAAEISVEVRYQ